MKPTIHIAIITLASIWYAVMASRAFAAEPTAVELAAEVSSALERKEFDAALARANLLLEQAPEAAGAWLLRAQVHAAKLDHQRAITDLDEAVRRAPDQPSLFQLRGSEHFKAGHIKESIADFDRVIEIDPRRLAGHWQRGISYYYAGRFDEGQRQFEAYQDVDDADVENVVWRYLCQARATSREQARDEMLEVGFDRRVPLMVVYDLFRDKASVADVEQAVAEGEPSERELASRRFYADLYLGLYYESQDDAERARKHLAAAAAAPLEGHYMWHVAKVHSQRLADTAAKE